MNRRIVSASLAILLAMGGITVASSRDPVTEPLGLNRLKATASGELVRGIATFDHVPTARDAGRLQALGLTVQRMEHMPLALVRGSVSRIASAVAAGAATDDYPDEQLEYLDQVSADSMGARGRSCERIHREGHHRRDRRLRL